MLKSVLWGLGAVVGLYFAWSIYLALVLRWEDEHTVGLAYYGRPLAERTRFKKSLRLHAVLLAPLLWINSKLAKVDFRRVRVQVQGTSFPGGSCSVYSVSKAIAYAPRPEDVFIVTQMKCGTTWMQHVVYQVLHRGRGDIVAKGGAMYALSPWLEGRRSVSIDDAPVVGTAARARIIKTHLPAQLCPKGDGARYIYVARHPVSCFASCVDFVATNVGAMAPPMAAYEEWFRSKDLMWWGTWTDHVKGWWDRARGNPRVLFLHFEDMKKDLASVVRQVTAFLGIPPLDDAELSAVVEQCGFAYMQEHQDHFEMHPPHILQTNAELFKAGTADRHKDVPADVRQRTLAWARVELKDSDYPLAAHYKDVAAAST